MTESSQLIRGLEGVVAAETRLCDLDGKNGRLAYGGYDIDELAQQATFEEVAYLLWHGELPTRVQLDRFQMELAVCAHHRVRSGQAPVPPAPGLSLAANFLYMLTGARPTAVTTRAFDACLTLYAEHELNASTFTTRVIAATLSDMHSAVAGGVGALKGTLHGGAGEAVMRTLLEVGRLDNVDAFVDRAMGEKRRLMGFGHRVYTAGDPRAAILKGMAEEACRQSGQALWYDLAVKLHAKVQATKRLIPNVDFYSAPLFYSIGIPVDLFTPVIATSRIAGWTANLLEQYDDNRLIRPRADYKGRPRRAFVAVDKR